MKENPDKWQGRFIRERKARQEAEQLLEDKSRELYEVNRKLSLQVQSQGSRLAEQEELFKSIFHASMDGIILFDGRGRIVEANNAALRMLGYSREIIIGSPVPKLLAPADRKVAKKALRQIITTGYCRHETNLVRVDGSFFPTEIVGSRTRVGGKTIIQGIIRDITQRRRAFADLKQARDEAQKANAAKSLFLASISHELRTPLNGVLGFTEMVLDTDLNEEQRQHLGLVKSSGDILLRTINDLLDFSRIESGKLLLEETRYSLRKVIQDTIAIQSASSEKKGLTLTSNFAAEIPEIIKGDLFRVQQVITNLISNAIKFTSEGSVTIAVTRTQNTLHVSVKDTGIGFEDSMAESLFESFTQADASTTRKYGGTGLGLAICRKLAAQMDGHLEAHGKPGEGAEFIFHFPLVVPSGEQEKVNPVHPPPSASGKLLGQGQRVLVAEDNTVNARLIVLILDRLGYSSSVVSNGIEVIQKLTEDDTYSIILMDRHMHGMDGIEACTRIRNGEAGENSQKIPIIAVTASTLTENREACLAAGMNGFLTKPLKPSELEAQLSLVLGSRHPKL